MSVEDLGQIPRSADTAALSIPKFNKATHCLRVTLRTRRASRTARQPLQRDERLLDHLVHHLRAATRLARVRADTRGLEHASNDLVPDSTLRLEQQRDQLDGDLGAAWMGG